MGPRLLVTGFGPFPGAPKNPTEALVRALAAEPAEVFGAGALRAVVLPTEYRKSWAILRRLYGSFAPDVVVHFGLSSRANSIVVERTAQKRCDTQKLDAVGFAPRFGWAARSGPESAMATLPAEAIVAALAVAGFPAELSDDVGGYVCNATLYRSLVSAQNERRMVGFIHVPPVDRNAVTAATLKEAATIILRVASASRLETIRGQSSSASRSRDFRRLTIGLRDYR